MLWTKYQKASIITAAFSFCINSPVQYRAPVPPTYMATVEHKFDKHEFWKKHITVPTSGAEKNTLNALLYSHKDNLCLFAPNSKWAGTDQPVSNQHSDVIEAQPV